MGRNRSSSQHESEQCEKLQVPDRPSFDEAKDAILAMRAVVIVRVTLPRTRQERFNIYLDGVLHQALAESAQVPARAYPICVDDPHLLILADRMPLRRL